MKVIRSSSGKKRRAKMFGILAGSAVATVVFVFLIASLGQAASKKYIRNNATGGDCTSIGTWDAATLTCTLTTDLTFTGTDGIEIVNNGITIDGNGHSLTGNGTNSGVFSKGRDNLTIKRLVITNFSNGIRLTNGSSGNSITDNTISNHRYGIYLNSSNTNTITGNTISNNTTYGIFYSGANNNTTYRNNLIDNATQVRISGGGSGNIFNLAAPAGGNYWSNWNTPDNDGDGFVDSPLVFTAGTDYLPFAGQSGWIDTAPPSVSSVLPAGTIYTSSTTVSASYADSGSFSSGIDTGSVSVTLDGSGLAGCTVTATGVSCPVSGLAAGVHTIDGSVADIAGNASPISGSFTVGDNVAPVLTYGGPGGTINDPIPAVTATYSDAAPSSGIDVSSATVVLNGGAPVTCTASAGNISCATGPLADGHYSAIVSITDNSGNTGTTGGAFDLDSTAPGVSNVQPSGTMIDAPASISADYSDSGSGIDTSSVTVTLNGNPLTGCTVTASAVSCPVAGLGYGIYTIGGSVSDNAGNASPISGNFEIVPPVDTIAPTVSGVYPSSIINTASTTIGADYNDAGFPSSGINAASVSITLDGDALAGCTVTASSVSCLVSDLGVGSHTIGGSVSDNAGNSSAISGSFTVADAADPLVSYAGPGGTITDNAPEITATYSDSAPSSGINDSSASVTLNGGAPIPCTASAGNISCATGPLADGHYDAAVSISDNAGNTGTASGSFDIDATAPAVSDVMPAGSMTSTSMIISAGYSDSGSGIDTASVSVTLDGNTLAGCTVTASSVSCPVSGLALGMHTIAGSVSDNAGNSSAISGSFEVIPPPDLTAPTVSNVQPLGTIYTSTTVVSADYNDDGTPSSGINTSAVSLTLDGNLLEDCTVTASSISCPASDLTVGAHTIGGVVFDYAGNSSSIDGNFTVGDEAAPVMTYGGPYGTISDPTPEITATYGDGGPSSGINDSSASVTLNGGAPIPCTASAGNITCPAETLSDGHYDVVVSISDNAGNTGTASGSFDIDATAPAVSDVQPAGSMTSTSVIISAGYSDSGSGIDTASVSVTLDGNTLAGCTVTASSVSCPISDLGVGSHTIGGSVSDNAGNSSVISGSFSVIDIVAPALTYVSPAGAFNDSNPQITATYSDSAPSSGINDSSASVTLNGGAPIPCSASAGNISCATGPLADGHYDAVVSISDNAGNTTTANGSFDLDTVAPVVSNVQPSGQMTSAPSSVSAELSEFGSGIDPAAVIVTLDGGTLSCTVTATYVSCPVSGLGIGFHTIGGSVSDHAGNSAAITGGFEIQLPPDITPPSIESIHPSGSISSDSTIAYIMYSDYESGINTSSVTVDLDGIPVSGCTVTATGVNCSLSNLSSGLHTLSGSVSDNAGNATAYNGSFNVAVIQPPSGGIAPHGGYGAGTDFCLSCHDVHDSAGDYVLMREATVTETCATCHNLFGIAPDATWTVAPPEFSGISATASQYSAYIFTGAAKLSGHDLGVSLNGEPSRNDDEIPGGSVGLRVIRSEDYEEGDRYDHESTTLFESTAGLYCASCHTPHGMITGHDYNGDGVEDAPMTREEGNFGRQLVADDSGSDHPKPVRPWSLLSNRPNHASQNVSPTDPIGAYNAFCVACHDQRDDGDDPLNDSLHNHPPLCVSCHNYSQEDFPHTRNQEALLRSNNDAACTSCHGHPISDPATGDPLAPLP